MERTLNQNRSSRKRKYEAENEEVQKRKTKKPRKWQNKSKRVKEQQSDGTNISETDSFTDAVNVNKLSKLIQSPEPEVILAKLLTPRFGFMERMNRGSTTQMLTEMLIQVISMACQSTDTDPLIKLLCHLNDSKFMKVDLLRYLNLFITDEGMSAKIEVLQKIISILVSLVGKFPRKSLDTVTLLLAPIHYLKHSRGIEISIEDLDEELISVRRHIQLKVPTHDLEREETCMTEAENFKWLSTAPTCEDIKGNADPYLRKNKIFLRYTNVNDYLDVQFRLLREDLIRPLREGLAELLESRKEGTDKKRKSLMKVYQKVQIVSWRCSPNGIIYKIHFDTSRLKRVRWGAGKRLIFGSIVCLSADQFQTMLIGTIAERNVKDLCTGIVYVSFENENAQVNSVQFNCFYEMIESPAYYEPYKNVLGVLQYLDEKSLPFQRYLLNHGHDEVPPPKYLLNKSVIFDFSCAIKRADKNCIEQQDGLPSRKKHALILNRSSWPSAEQFGLDDSQYGALKAALTKEFSVIQGPPGTGKTFIGVLIVQLLLANKNRPISYFKNPFPHIERNREPLWDGPILIVCYTNHALDQFLEEIIKRHPDKVNNNKIVRIGSRCSSENESLKRCQLYEIKRHLSWRSEIGWAKGRLSDIEDQLTCSAAFAELAQEELLHEDVLKDFMSHGQFEMLTRAKLGWEPSILLRWLNDTRGNAWQSDVLRDDAEDACIQEDADCYEDQWGEQVGRQSDFDNIRSLYDFRGCKEKMRKEAFFNVSQSNIYFDPWQFLRKIHQRFQEKEPIYEANVWTLSLDSRWRLYNFWVSLCIKEKMAEWQTMLQEYSQEKTKLDDTQNNEHCKILAEAEIVAMTTSAAAKNNNLLKIVKPKIVIVEEAAEVLEAHIVASLSEDCQHLILIGDHQQLRPKPADNRLAKQYWLHVSLFERMLLNRMNCECLAIQHRMRPEISKLLVPHIYRSLCDHNNVQEYENIAGVMGNLFFLNHSVEENSVDDMKSHSNEHEASFLADFCKYLLHIGYSPDKITVLTLYTGQLFLLKKYFPKKDFEGVRITPVDNFQGEENDIILLSLVRSNKKNNIGFLSIPNRVCVALSRARKGLYIIGNGDLLRDASPLWRDILKTLKNDGKLVDKLPLGCRKHPDNVFSVACAADFSDVPAYGCKYPCEYRLDCGHVCDRNCHPFDQKHKKYKCTKACARKPEHCTYGHKCQKRCSEYCGECEVLVKRTLPGCQHEATMPCYVDENEFGCEERCKKLCRAGHQCRKKCWEDCADCVEPVTKILTLCQHEATMPCHMNENEFLCKERCKEICEAGHQCKKMCCEYCGDCTEPVTRILTLCQHEATMPCHMNEEMYLQRNSCRVQVERILTKCGHLARMACYRSEFNYPCLEACKKSCSAGHACQKKCREICGKCEVMVEKVLPRCQHRVSLPCHQSEETYACKNKCSKTCPEGHPCLKLCHEPCGDCEVPVLRTLPLCEHEAEIACHVVLSEYICIKPCKRLCPFGHKCPKICGVNCGNCQVRVTKVLPRCKHSNKIECHQSPDEVICLLPCKKSLPCGHKCQEICGEPECTVFCKTKVEKVLPCGHNVTVECFEDPERYQCRKKIEVTTCTYGHKKMVECCNSVTDFSQCQTLATKTCSTKLHKFTVLCNLQNSIQYNHGCQKKCNVKLKCGHRCVNICQQCVTDARHSDCTHVCNKYYPLCSHKCLRDCVYPCGTCCNMWEIKCHHRSLVQGCNTPYKPCDKPCRWSCPHQSCKAKCSHPCDRLPCNEPCHNKVRKCGHRCVGLCGEVCPQICRLCDNIKLKEMTEDLSVKITEESRFLILKPCDHVVEKTYMDSWVKRHMKMLPPYKLNGSAFLKCPVCTSKVSYCPRYNREMKTYELHINMAKARIVESKNLARKASEYTVFNRFHIDIPKDIIKHRLNLGTFCLLCKTQALLDSLGKNDRLSLLSDEIANAVYLNVLSIDGDQSSVATDVIRVYRMYLEMQVCRLKRSTRGPKLKIIESCEDIFKSLSSVSAEESDFQKMWNSIEKVNSRLSTKLSIRERKDDIEDYIQHLNQFYDLELNASFDSQWFCCTNGHVYSREEDVKEDQIDSNCPSCHPVHKRLLKILQANQSKASIASSKDVGANEHCHDESKKITGTKLDTNTTTRSSDEITIGDVPLKEEADINNKRSTISSASTKSVAAEPTATKTTAKVATATPTKLGALAKATAANVTSRVPATTKDDQDRSRDKSTARLNHAKGSASSKKTQSEEVRDLFTGKRPPERNNIWSRRQIPDSESGSRKRRRPDSPTDGNSRGHWDEPRTVISLGHNRGYAFEKELREYKRLKSSVSDHRSSYEEISIQRTNRRTPDEERYPDPQKRNTEGLRRYHRTGDRSEPVYSNKHGIKRTSFSVHQPVAERRISSEYDTPLSESYSSDFKPFRLDRRASGFNPSMTSVGYSPQLIRRVISLSNDNVTLKRYF